MDKNNWNISGTISLLYRLLSYVNEFKGAFNYIITSTVVYDINDHGRQASPYDVPALSEYKLHVATINVP